LNISYFSGFDFDAGNTFTMQLSDSSGDFTTPVDIGSISGTTSGSIFCLIPMITPTGTHYRIRVIADQPGIIGYDNGNDITITQINSVASLNGISGAGIYPNPSGNHALYEFTSGNSSAYSYQLLDQSGKIVLQGEGKSVIGKNAIELNTEKFARGIYQFNLNSNGTKLSERLIISR